MKTLALFLALTSAAFAGQTTTTGPAYDVTTNSATISGYIVSDVYTAQYNFAYGTSANNLPNSTTPAYISASNSVTATANLTNLNIGVVYYYTLKTTGPAGAQSGSTNLFVTTQAGYVYNNNQLQGLDRNRPQGSEPGSVWASALRQVKAALLDWAGVEHNLDGSHASGFIKAGTYLSEQSVVYSNLAQDVRDFVVNAGTSGVANIFVTNALTYYSSQSGVATKIPLSNQWVTIGSRTIHSNNFNQILITYETLLNLGASVNQGKFCVAETNSGYTTAQSFPSVGSYSTRICGSFMVPGLNTTDIVYNITARMLGNSSSFTSNANSTNVLENIRAWGLP